MAYYWWQRQATCTVHSGYRMRNEYEVCVELDGSQHYTGRSRQVYG